MEAASMVCPSHADGDDRTTSRTARIAARLVGHRQALADARPGMVAVCALTGLLATICSTLPDRTLYGTAHLNDAGVVGYIEDIRIRADDTSDVVQRQLRRGYMNKLFAYGYALGSQGYRWGKLPPGLDATPASAIRTTAIGPGG